MFGNAYFGNRYFGDPYFGPGVVVPPIPPTPPTPEIDAVIDSRRLFGREYGTTPEWMRALARIQWERQHRRRRKLPWIEDVPTWAEIEKEEEEWLLGLADSSGALLPA